MRKPHAGAAILLFASMAALTSPALTLPALARPGGEPSSPRSRDARVIAERFVADADAARALGRGAITIAPEANSSADRSDDRSAAPSLIAPAASQNRAAFEAALIDQLVRAGYDTAKSAPVAAQIAELRVSRHVVAPAEPPRKPLSGQAAMAVGNRGAAYGLALNLDMSKPAPALVSTRIDARIRDGAQGRILWEGRAEMTTPEGDARWSDQAIAARLTQSLFAGFPQPSAPFPPPAAEALASPGAPSQFRPI